MGSLSTILTCNTCWLSKNISALFTQGFFFTCISSLRKGTARIGRPVTGAGLFTSCKTSCSSMNICFSAPLISTTTPFNFLLFFWRMEAPNSTTIPTAAIAQSVRMNIFFQFNFFMVIIADDSLIILLQDSPACQYLRHLPLPIVQVDWFLPNPETPSSPTPAFG